MQQREADYFAATKDLVHFAVGAIGSDATNAGFCYRITARGVKKDIIMQVYLTHCHPSPPLLTSYPYSQTITSQYSNNVRILVAGGMLGLKEACTSSGSNVPMFSGDNSVWGATYTGLADKYFCMYLPDQPLCQPSPPADSMFNLCNISAVTGVLTQNRITSLCQVPCPSQLYEATGLHRLDEGVTATKCTAATTSYGEYDLT
jgi:hypothetical protein